VSLQPNPSAEALLAALEAELGEKTLYRTTGRLLAAEGLTDVPLDSWGLIALTPTRVVFRHFPQAHPLFGGRDEERRFEAPRSRFSACVPRRLSWWQKLVTGTPEHVALVGEGCQLALETGEDVRRFAEAWATPAG